MADAGFDPKKSSTMHLHNVLTTPGPIPRRLLRLWVIELQLDGTLGNIFALIGFVDAERSRISDGTMYTNPLSSPLRIQTTLPHRECDRCYQKMK